MYSDSVFLSAAAERLSASRCAFGSRMVSVEVFMHAAYAMQDRTQDAAALLPWCKLRLKFTFPPISRRSWAPLHGKTSFERECPAAVCSVPMLKMLAARSVVSAAGVQIPEVHEPDQIFHVEGRSRHSTLWRV